MKRYMGLKSVLIASIALLGLNGMVRPGLAVPVEVKSETDTFNVDGRFQLLGTLEHLDDPYNDSDRLYLFLKQARLNFNGQVKQCEYALQLMFGGEEVPERNSVMSLLDAYVDVPISEDAFRVKIGQFKVPYSRERLFDSGDFLHVDRSINNAYFNLGRDVGVAAHGSAGQLTGAAGIFTGGGPNIPQRYLPEDLEVPMLVTRFGVNSGLDQDVFTPYNFEAMQGKAGHAAYINAAYTKDSRVGHSSPLNTKYLDKSLMLDSAWNPYIAASDQKAEYYQLGGDVAIQRPISATCDLLLSAEINYADFKNDVGELQSSGGVTSADLLFKNWALSLRYAVVSPDENMAYTYTDAVTEETTLYQITDKNIQEIGGSIVRFIRNHNLKLIADLIVQMDVPVAIEEGNGAYNLMAQSDQVSYAANEGIELQENYIGKLMVQYEF